MAELNVSEIEEEEERNEALLELVRSKKFRTLRQVLSEMNEVDVAAFIEELDPEKTVVVFRMLPKELASDVFACLELDKQCISRLLECRKRFFCSPGSLR